VPRNGNPDKAAKRGRVVIVVVEAKLTNQANRRTLKHRVENLAVDMVERQRFEPAAHESIPEPIIVEPFQAKRTGFAARVAIAGAVEQNVHRPQPLLAILLQQFLLARLQFAPLRRRARPILQGDLHLDELAARIALLVQQIAIGHVRGEIVWVLAQRRLQHLSQSARHDGALC
jgi:hypothetical protein